MSRKVHLRQDGLLYARECTLVAGTIEWSGETCVQTLQAARTTLDQSAKRVRWAGIWWDGRPWLARLRVRSPIYVVPAAGCGCMARPKSWYVRLKSFLSRRRAAGV